jgi:hypothetical protein
MSPTLPRDGSAGTFLVLPVFGTVEFVIIARPVVDLILQFPAYIVVGLV